MALNQINDYLWIGSLTSLTAYKTMEENRITHIITALRGDISGGLLFGKTYQEHLENKKRLKIEIDDDEDEDIAQYFGQTNAFIDEARKAGEATLVHCQAGISRSGTIVTAYMMRENPTWTVDEAIDHIRQFRSAVNPNPFFREQLQVYKDCGYVINTDKPAYRQFLLKLQSIRESTPTFAPTVKHYSEPAPSQADSQLRCRKCRSLLATSDLFIRHVPKNGHGPAVQLSPHSTLPPECNQYFIEPVSWMRPELEKGELDGKLNCPKCRAKLGTYAWSGSKCSCGMWVTPSFSIQKAKVDEIVKARV